MIFLKPHWTAAVTAEADTFGAVSIRLSWIQGSIGEELILQGNHQYGLYVVNGPEDCYTMEVEASRIVDQFYVPIKKVILLGEKMPVHSPNIPFITTINNVSNALHTVLKNISREFGVHDERKNKFPVAKIICDALATKTPSSAVEFLAKAGITATTLRKAFVFNDEETIHTGSVTDFYA